MIDDGQYEDIISCKESVTGQYLSGEKEIAVPKKRHQCDNGPDGKWLELLGASGNNL